jgi:hypothetical protein
MTSFREGGGQVNRAKMTSIDFNYGSIMGELMGQFLFGLMTFLGTTLVQQ